LREVRGCMIEGEQRGYNEGRREEGVMEREKEQEIDRRREGEGVEREGEMETEREITTGLVNLLHHFNGFGQFTAISICFRLEIGLVTCIFQSVAWVAIEKTKCRTDPVLVAPT